MDAVVAYYVMAHYWRHCCLGLCISPQTAFDVTTRRNELYYWHAYTSLAPLYIVLRGQTSDGPWRLSGVCNTARRACRRPHPRRPGDDIMPPAVNYSSMVTLHSRPVVLCFVGATPCYYFSIDCYLYDTFVLQLVNVGGLQHSRHRVNCRSPWKTRCCSGWTNPRRHCIDLLALTCQWNNWPISMNSVMGFISPHPSASTIALTCSLKVSVSAADYTIMRMLNTDSSLYPFTQSNHIWA